jgi:nitrogen regulatory protein PII
MPRPLLRPDDPESSKRGPGDRGPRRRAARGGRPPILTDRFRGTRGSKLKIEIGVRDDAFEDVIDAITQGAGTGKIADGKIFVDALQDAARIRNGERGHAAV